MNEFQNPFVRITGQHRRASEVLHTAALRAGFPVRILPNASTPTEDYAQIDLSLAATEPSDAKSSNPKLTNKKAVAKPITLPDRGLSYAGFSPEQRAWFLEWLADPSRSAPAAFQQLYLANVEVALFEEQPIAADALENLLTLNAMPVWRDHLGLSRSILLGLWLQQNGEQLAQWIASGNIHPALLGVAAGHLALLCKEISAEIVGTLLRRWAIVHAVPSANVLALRLDLQRERLGADPLAFALSQLDDDHGDAAVNNIAAAKEPQLWRCQHRDLRIALPQPDLHPPLEPLLRELVDDLEGVEDMGDPSVPDPRVIVDGETGNEVGSDVDEIADRPWTLILEFGESRSEYFPYALMRAKERPSFTQLMDEDRRLVYRISYRKRELRHFWRLWDYVSNWSGTTVYVNGKELENYQVWPYSQFLR